MSAGPIDVHIGGRIRQRRQELGLSQAKIGRACGVSWQQASKFDYGANRIAASQLWLIAQALKVPIGYFFEGLEP
jgi:transcriptional regulator with XRE-family HTH domain